MGDFRMAFRRASAIATALAVVMGMAALASPSFAQEKRKLSKDELSQYEAIHGTVDAVIAGKQPAPADVKVGFRNHFLKSGEDIYIPYTVELEPGRSCHLRRRCTFGPRPKGRHSGCETGREGKSGGQRPNVWRRPHLCL